MSGQNESWIDDFVKKIKSITIDEVLGFRVEVEEILNYTPVQLKSLPPEQCAEDAVVLNQFCYHIQKSQNYYLSRKNWADSVIKVKANTSNYNSWSYEERKMSAIKDDNFLRKVYDIFLHTQRISDELNFLSSRAESMAKSLINLQHSKERNR